MKFPFISKITQQYPNSYKIKDLSILLEIIPLLENKHIPFSISNIVNDLDKIIPIASTIDWCGYSYIERNYIIKNVIQLSLNSFLKLQNVETEKNFICLDYLTTEFLKQKYKIFPRTLTYHAYKIWFLTYKEELLLFEK